MGPSAEATSCEGCIGNNVSTFGVCLECILGLVSNDDHTRCETYTARKAIQRQVFVSWHANRSCCWPVAAKCTKAQSQASSLRPRLSAAAPTNIVSRQWTLFACFVVCSLCLNGPLLSQTTPQNRHIFVTTEATMHPCTVWPSRTKSQISRGPARAVTRALSTSSGKAVCLAKTASLWSAPGSWCLESQQTASVVLPSCLRMLLQAVTKWSACSGEIGHTSRFCNFSHSRQSVLRSWC